MFDFKRRMYSCNVLWYIHFKDYDNMDLEIFEKLPNREFAFKCLSILQSEDLLDETVLYTLTNIDECHRLFCCSSKFSILKEIEKDSSTEELHVQCNYNRGKQRYYKDILIISNKHYIVSNHWYGPNKSMPDNRTPVYLGLN